MTVTIISVGISEMIDRVSPEVVEIVRRDLIQKVGNAFRFHYREKRDQAHLEQIVELAGKEWGDW